MTVLLNVLLMLAACVGNTQIWVMVTNRAYSLRIRHRVLRCFRAIMDLLILGYPILLIWLTGTGSNGLIRGGSPGDLSVSARCVLFVPLVGVPFCIAGIARWWLIARAEFHEADSREIIDVAAAARAEGPNVEKDVRGRQSIVFRLWPWNEIFQLEVNHKTAWVNGTADRSGETLLRIAHLSDLHVVGCPGPGWYREVVRQVRRLQPDVIVFTGDLIDDPELLNEACEVLSPLPQQAPSFFVLGNHDWRYEIAPIRQGLIDTGWTDLNSTSETHQIAGRSVLFAGNELPWLGTAPPAATGDDELSILLSHSPDQISFARRAGFDLMFCGHTHGGQVVLPVVGPVFSPSRYGVRYASGMFREANLTMHVSRGAGARAPLRWNCRPELTCVTVRCR